MLGYRFGTRWVATLPIMAALGVSGAATQQPPVQPRPPLTFGSEISLVAVPVFVTDRSGRSVAGLRAEDFEIEENGRAKPIVGFHPVDVDEPWADEGEDGGFGVPVPLAVRAEAPRQFVILFDRLFTSAQGLRLGRKAAVDFVRTGLAPTDLVAVVTTGPAGFKTLTDFTNDHEFAASVLDGTARSKPAIPDPLGVQSFTATSGFGLFGVAPAQVRGDLSAGGGAGDAAEGEFAELNELMASADAGALGRSALEYVRNLHRMVIALSPLRGRKQIVLLSDGLPDTTWNDPDLRQPSVRAELDKLFEAARAGDVAFNTIGLSGIQPANDIAAGWPGEVPKPAPGINQSAGQGTLTALANNTGGHFVRPRGDFGKALREVDDASRRFYVLAFEASDSAKKKPQRFSIHVKRGGYKVAHRASYSLKPRTDGAGQQRFLAAESIAKGLSGGMRLHLAALPYKDRGGNPTVHAALHIDASEFADVPPNTPLAIEVYGYLMSNGRVADSIALSTQADVAKLGTSLRKNGLTVLTGFPVSSGSADLRFFVRLGKSGPSGALRRVVEVPSFHRSDLTASVPMMAASPDGRIVIPFQPAGRPALEVPFRVANDRFVPDPSVLTPGRGTETVVFLWRGDASNETPLGVTAELIRPDDQPRRIAIEGAPRVARDVDGFDRYLLTLLPPAGLEAGAYRLRLQFRDPVSGRTASSETMVDVEG